MPMASAEQVACTHRLFPGLGQHVGMLVASPQQQLAAAAASALTQDPSVQQQRGCRPCTHAALSWQPSDCSFFCLTLCIADKRTAEFADSACSQLLPPRPAVPGHASQQGTRTEPNRGFPPSVATASCKPLNGSRGPPALHPPHPKSPKCRLTADER